MIAFTSTFSMFGHYYYTTPNTIHAMRCNAFYDCTHKHVYKARTHARTLHCDNEQNTQLKWNPTKNNHKLILSKKFCGCLLFAFGSASRIFSLLLFMCSGNCVCAGTIWAQAEQRATFALCFCWHMFTVRYFVCVRASACMLIYSPFCAIHDVYEFVRFLIRSNTLNNAMGKCKRSETRSSKH